MQVRSCYYLYLTLLHSYPSGLQTGDRHSLAELHKMVAADPEMQNLTDEKKQEYLSTLSNTRDTQKQGVRANNAAASRDVLKAVESIQDQVSPKIYMILECSLMYLLRTARPSA